MALRSFLFSDVGRVLVKALERKEAVSDLTEGFLLFRASRTSSNMDSIVVWNGIRSCG